MQSIKFTDEILTPTPTGGIDAQTSMAHFAIITYCVDPESLRPLIHERFELVTIPAENSGTKALISVVPFLDLDFCFVNCPWPKFQFGQTNYRAYVIDRETGENVVWFFGTSLDSITNLIPRYFWKLPWNRGRITFDCEYSEEEKRYLRYRMSTKSDWAPAELEISDSGLPVQTLDGFPDLETGLVILTHPIKGYYYRRNNTLGSYSIWHDRLELTSGKLEMAKFGLLDRLGLVQEGDLNSVHSVLMTKQTHFKVYLPPITLKDV